MKKLLLIAIALATSLAASPAWAQSLAKTFTLNAANQCARIGVTNLPTVGISVSGTFSMTLQPEVAIAGQTTPQDSQVTPSTSQTAQSTITSAGNYAAPVAGYDNFYLCVSSYSSGTATVLLNPSAAVNTSTLAGGGGIPGYPSALTQLATANNGTGNMDIGATSTGYVALETAAGGNADMSDDAGGGDTVTVGPYTSDSASNGYFMQTANGLEILAGCTNVGCPSLSAGIFLGLANDTSGIYVDTGGNTNISNLAKPTDIAAQATAGTFGVPVVVASSLLTGRTTALGTTTLFTVGAATGTFRVTALVNCDTSVSTATATLTVVYTDSSDTAITTTGSGALCTTLGAAAQQVISLPLIRAYHGTTITWAIAIANSPNFDASALVERIQ